MFDREFRPEFVFDGGEELLELFLRFGNFFALRLDGVVQLFDAGSLVGEVCVQFLDAGGLVGDICIQFLD